MTDRINLSLLAGYPPPYGGVANHVLRLSDLLDRSDVEHVIYNAVSESTDGRRVVSVAKNRRRWLLKYAVTAPERVVYLFSARLEAWLVGAFMARTRSKRVIVRLRNQALPRYLRDPRTRHTAAWCLRQMTRVVAVSRALADAAREAGVTEERIIHQPGFLPPPTRADGDDGLSRSQRTFLSNHTPLIAANGKVGWHDGTDLYGLDHMVELVARLKETHPRIGLAISFWDHLPADEQRLNDLRRRATELGVRDQILFHTESRPFVPVLERSDLFIRPTCTDGDANSVREALFLGVPAIASDVVERPDGTVLHRTRDFDQMLERVQATLASPKPRSPRLDVVDMKAVEGYVSMLKELADA